MTLPYKWIMLRNSAIRERNLFEFVIFTTFPVSAIDAS